MDREIVGKIENPPTQVEGFLYRGMKATAAVAFGSLCCERLFATKQDGLLCFAMNGRGDLPARDGKIRFMQSRIMNDHKIIS
jgi:hypothetical protein